MTRAGIELYSALVASVLAAFPAPIRVIFLDDPAEIHKTLPLLPSHLNSNSRRKHRPEELTTTTSSKSDGKLIQTYSAEPRRMALDRVMEYFCDTIGTVLDHGGMDDLTWYELEIRKSFRAAKLELLAEWKDIETRYAVHKVTDETGYSGRERLTVRFG